MNNIFDIFTHPSRPRTIHGIARRLLPSPLMGEGRVRVIFILPLS